MKSSRKRVQRKGSRTGARAVTAAATVAGLFALHSAARAATKSWTGAQVGTNAEFSNGNNWSPTGAPGAADTAIIDDGGAANPSVYTANISSGAVSVTAIILGNTTQGSGNVNLLGGTLTVSGALNISNGNLLNTDVSDFNMSGGTLLVNGTGRLIVGLQGDGEMDVSGGAVINISNGTTTYVGYGGTFNGNATRAVGVLNVTGGTVALAGLELGHFGSNPNGNGGDGTVNLGGGVLSGNFFNGGSGSSANPGTSTLNFSGGTLQASSTANAAFMQGLTTVNVMAGGAVIDSNGRNIAINQRLVNGTGGPDGGLTKLGAGLLTLATTNTYTGNTTVSAGQLDVFIPAALPSSAANTTIANGAGLVIGVGNTSNGQAAWSSASLPASSNYTGIATFTGPLAYIGVDTGDGANAAGLTFSGIITDGQLPGTPVTQIGFVKAGANTLTLTSANTYTGGTIAQGGTLALATGGATPAFTGPLTIGNSATVAATVPAALGNGSTGTTVSTLTVNNGGTFSLATTAAAEQGFHTNLVMNGGTVSATNAGSALAFSTGYGISTPATSTISSNINIRGDEGANTLPIDVSNGATLTVSGVIAQAGFASGSGALTKTGLGTLTLSNGNTFAGATTVNAGQLNLSYDTGTAPTGSSGTVGTLSGPLTINGGTVSATLKDALGTNTGGFGTVPLLTVNAGGTFALAVNAGGASSGNEGKYTNVVLNGGSVTTANVANNFFGFAAGFGINANSGASTFAPSVLIRSSAAISVNVGSGASLAMSGVITDVDGSTNPHGSIIKTGPGTLALSGNSIYNNGTTIQAGTVQANATTSSFGTTVAGGTNVVNVSGGSLASTATLAGTGNTGSGKVVIGSFGIITAGTGSTLADTAGTLTIAGTLAWNTGGSYVAKYDGTTTDKLVVSSLTTPASGFVVNYQEKVVGSTPTGTYSLAVDRGITSSGSFNLPALTLEVNGSTSIPTGYSFSDTVSGGFDTLQLSVVAAPEPASLALAGTTIVPVLIRRRRRH